MYSPSPPAPTAAAIVAVPTPITAATRMPATIDGQRQRKLDLPQQLPRRHAQRHARFDERRDRPSAIPATVVRTIGSSA